MGNPIGVVCNVLCLYGVMMPERAAALLRDEPMAVLLPFTVGMAILQALTRMGMVGRVYGWQMAVTVPLRIPLANWINTLAGLQAAWRFLRSQVRREPLVWLKTQHQYPNRFALEAHRPTLSEVLVKSGYLEEAALEGKPAGRRLQDWLVESGRLSESDLYEALSLQLSLPICPVAMESLSREVVRALPAHIVRRHQVVPIRVEGGQLVLAGPEAPPETLVLSLRPYTKLHVKFELVQRSTFEQILEEHF